MDAKRDTNTGDLVRAAAAALSAPDVFVFRRVSADRYVHVGGLGRGEGWAGNVELTAGDEPELFAEIQRGEPITLAAPERTAVVGPYYARSAFLVPISHDVVVLFGSPDAELPHRSGAELLALARAAAEAVEFVSPAKRLADELEVLHAVQALANTDARRLDDVMRHVVDTAAASLSCELGVLHLFDPEHVTLVPRGWKLEADEDVVLAAMRALRTREAAAPLCVQETTEESLPPPFTRSAGVRSYYLLALGTPPIANLLLMHTAAFPRGFTTLCKELGLRLTEPAEALLRTALVRELDEHVRHAQKLESLGVMAGGIAHDFNNLLVGVLGNAELALRELAVDSPARERLEHLEQAAQRAAELSRQMLVYSGGGTFTSEVFDLSESIAGMGSLLHSVVSRRSVLTFDLAPGLAIEGDRHQLGQVAMNLVANAAEALADEGGRVAVRTFAVERDRPQLGRYLLGDDLPEGRYASLQVSDDGCGMPPETVEKIFEPFFTTKFTGRGLGLAATLGIIRAHRGAVSVQSEGGRGTTFAVIFPLADAPFAAVSPGAPKPEEQPATGGTVLVADDEEAVRAVVASMLARAGFAVVTANDGEEALVRLRERGSELVAAVIDLTMPAKGGDEVLRELRADGNQLPVILSSGYSCAITAEVDDRVVFLQKPYRMAELIERLNELVAAA